MDRMLRKAGVRIEDVSLFGVAIGPGSFTGIRVGIASVKGLAHALSKPAVGVSSLEALAYAAGVSGTICSCVDALRGEIYAQLFEVTSDDRVVALNEPTVAAPEAVAESLTVNDIAFIGHGAEAFAEVFERRATALGTTFTRCLRVLRWPSGWITLPAPPFLAPSVGAVTYARFRSGRGADAATLEALYVRPSDAEAKRRLKLLGQLPN